MKATFTVNHAAFARGLDAEAKRLTTAARLSANELAWRGVERIRENMRRIFFMPSEYIQNGLTVEFARDRDFAVVDWLRPATARSGPGAGRVLRAQIEGGTRRDKRLEAALRFLGLPRGLIAVPGPHAKLDRSGDMDGNLLRRILQDLRQQGPRVRRRYFVILNRDGKIKIPRGIYETAQRDQKPKLLVAFVADPTYTPRFNPVAVVRETVRLEAAEVWRLAVERRLPLRTSRGGIRA